MSQSLTLTTGLAYGSSFPKGKLELALISPGAPAAQLRVTGIRPGGHDDLYLGTEELTSKNRIKTLGLDAILDVEAEAVNAILDVAEPLDQLKVKLRKFGEFIGMTLAPIAIRDITWKTVYIAQGITVGCEPDEYDEYDEYDDDCDALWFPESASSNSRSGSDGTDAAFLVGFSTTGDPFDLAPAELPLLTTLEGTQGTKQRLVIFANEFFEIRRSPTAGWGAFAIKELRKKDVILVEKALYHAIHENVTRSVRELPKKERAIANDMHAYFSRDGETLEEAIWSTNSFVSRLPIKPDADGVYRRRPSSPQDVAGLFPVAGRFNHSCSPKVDYKFSVKHEALVFTVRDWVIEAGEELTIDYGKDPSVLYYKYGFSCECGYCRGFDAMQSEWF